MLTGRTVLIVEDEFLIATLLSDIVEDLGMVVCGIADTADGAVTAVAGEHPELVLMDVRLKGVRDGIDAAHEIHDCCGCPVIFITASREPTTVSRIKQDHPAAILFKPVNPRLLRDTLETLFPN